VFIDLIHLCYYYCRWKLGCCRHCSLYNPPCNKVTSICNYHCCLFLNGRIMIT
jgi:hypothetical protein